MNISERRARTQRKINQRVRKANWLDWGYDPIEPHTWHKTTVGGCNQTACVLCHYEKLYWIRDVVLRSNDELKDELDEIYST